MKRTRLKSADVTADVREGFGGSTRGSRLVMKIKGMLLDEFEELDAEDQYFVLSQLEQTIGQLRENPKVGAL